MLAQRFSATGAKLGGEIAVSGFADFGTPISPRAISDVAVAADGGFVVVWQQGENFFLRLFDAAGAPRGDASQFSAGGTNYGEDPSVAMDDAGNFAVTWVFNMPGGGRAVQVQRFDAMGVAQGAAAVLPSGLMPKIAMAANGDHVVTWDTNFSANTDGDLQGVYAQRFNPAGVAQGATFLVNTVTTARQESPAIAMDAAGNFVIAWDSGDTTGPGLDGFRHGIYAQRYDALGNRLGDEFRVNSTTHGDQQTSSIAMNADGFVVTWVSEGQDGSFLGIYAQRYDALGNRLGGEFRVNLDTLGSQNRPAVAMAPDGRFTIVWDSAVGITDGRFFTGPETSSADGSGGGILVRSFQADGLPAPAVLLDLDTSAAGPGRSIGFVPGAAPQAVLDERIAIDAPGLPFLTGATAALEARPDGAAAETLLLDAAATAAAAAAGLSVAWNATTGVLGISGSATVTVYETVLRGLSYANSAVAPTGADRVVAVQLAAPGGVQSQVTRATLTDWGGTPGLTLDLDAAVSGIGTGSQTVALSDQGTTRIFGTEISIGTLGVAGITGATVQTDGWAEPLVLTAEALAAATAAGITASWDIATTRLTLSGTASAAAYEAALEGLRLGLPAPLGVRTLSVEVTGEGGATATASGTLRVEAGGGADIALPMPAHTSVSTPEIAFDPAGNLLVAWQATGDDGDPATTGNAGGIFMRRLDANGTPSSAVFHVDQEASASQGDATFAVAPDGSFVVAWVSLAGQDGSLGGIYARRFDANLQPLGGEFLVNAVTLGSQQQPSIGIDGAGNFMIAWLSPPDDVSSATRTADIFARRFAADGTALGNQFLVNTTTAGGQVNPAVAMNENGGAVIAWTSRQLDGATLLPGDVLAQRFAADGTKLGDEFIVNGTLPGSQASPSVGINALGGFVVAWMGAAAGDSAGIVARRYGADGVALGDEFLVNTTTAGSQQLQSVAMRPDGSFVISWEALGPDGVAFDIFAQRYDANGAAAGGEFRVSGSTPGSQQSSEVAVAPDGGFAVAWAFTATNSVGVNFFNADGSSKAVDLDLSTPGSGFATSFAPGGTPARIADSDATINGNIAPLTLSPAASFVGAVESLGTLGFTFATATLSGRSDGAAEFLYLGAGPAPGIDATWDEATGTLTLRGPGSFGEFLGAMQSVRYLNTDTTPTFGDRSVAVRFFGQPVATDIVTATITVGNAAPTAIGLSASTLAENAAGAAIGTLTVTDPDAGQAHSFTLSDNRFEVVGGVLRLKPGIALDYEAAPQVDLEVTATDPGGLSFTDSFTIQVGNLAETLRGTSGGDTLSGAEHMLGLAGSDSLVGSGAADRLNGGADNDTLVGGAGNDVFGGGTGADSMVGGLGNDTFVVDDLGDAILELPGGGYDWAVASVSSTLGAELERLSLAGTANLNGTGNALDNRLDGNAGANLLSGLEGNDALHGGAGNDTLVGGAGNDLLDGGTGADSMAGGLGSDTYQVDQAGDVALELVGGGYDRVVASISWTLGAELERLSLTGTASLNGTGNALNNRLDGNAGTNILDGDAGNDLLSGGTGNDSLVGGEGTDTLSGGAGADRLRGGLGADRLTGDAGADAFIYGSPAEGSDMITDFTRGDDRIWISRAGFGNLLATGDLAAGHLTVGAAAAGAGAQFVYAPGTGRLSWDADGAAAGAAVLLATLTNKPLMLEASDVLVIA